MMGGLAYMTGPPGRPMRAGTSINDIAGGLFAAIAILAALLRARPQPAAAATCRPACSRPTWRWSPSTWRRRGGGKDPTPYGDPDMPKPWPIYDVFDTADPGEQVHVSVVTETQWRAFCEGFGLQDLLADPDAFDDAGPRSFTRDLRSAAVRRRLQDAREAGAYGPLRAARHSLRTDRQALGHVRRSPSQRFGRPAGGGNGDGGGGALGQAGDGGRGPAGVAHFAHRRPARAAPPAAADSASTAPRSRAKRGFAPRRSTSFSAPACW